MLIINPFFNKKYWFLSLLVCLLIASCKRDDEKQKPVVEHEDKTEFFLELVSPLKSNLYFTNRVVETSKHNYWNYEQIYNGSGVAAGDLNNDGLPDIYFGGNTFFDKLYLNNGALKFEDITISSGISGVHDGWTMGINFVDINADGWLDIYVSRSGPHDDPEKRKNKLFINNRDLTFREAAEEFGIANTGYSIQSAFFDYDLDGDLDMYLMNHPDPSFQTNNLQIDELRKEIASGRIRTDYFYENTDKGFVDKTKEAGLLNFGYRHGIAVGDINADGYPDLYITSDFDGADLLYINTGHKGFKNTINEQLGHTSYSSMGNELSDINNDGLLDIYVVDMAPDDHVRSKVEMPSMNIKRFHSLVKNGYHHQYMGNTLHLNNGHDNFSEISQLSGITKSDWSWAPLFFDIDLDGKKDLYITNGVKRKFIYGDFNKTLSDKSKELNRKLDFNEITDLALNDVIPNSVYKYMGNLKYKKVTEAWVDNGRFNSNGVAYADFDNDGDLDLITNNMEENASLYENKAANNLGGNYLKLKLIGPEKNKFAIGSKVKMKIGNEILFQELHNARGYLSSVDHELVFGLGNADKVDEVEIQWPDGKFTILKNLKSNTAYISDYKLENKFNKEPQNKKSSFLSKVNLESIGINYLHTENPFDDFSEQILLPYSQSHNGPFISSADVNNDGLDDFFVGGAIGMPGALYVQGINGKFIEKKGAWYSDSSYEDLGVLFFDSDSDGDQDLYVVSGGSEFPEKSKNYYDRLYINDGSGNFNKDLSALPQLPVSGQIVVANDIDNDGDLDLCIGGRVIPGKYPFSPKTYLLRNDQGKFKDVTADQAPELREAGMLTAIKFVDYDNDGDDDLVAVGEWTPIQFFENNNGNFKVVNIKGLEKSVGLWFGLESADLDKDGDIDFVVGNLGLNTKFKTQEGKAFHIYCDDFDQSGTYDVVLSNLYKGNLVPSRGRECSSQQMPIIIEQFPSFEEFAHASLVDIYGQENLDEALHYKADLLYSVYVENLGSGNFKIHKLPVEAQFSPLKDFKFLDIDGDNQMELIAVGNMYHTEVETARYDALFGCVMKFELGKFSIINSQLSGFVNIGDARRMAVLKQSNNGNLLIVTNNDGALNGFQVK